MGIYIRQKVLRQMHVLKTFAPARQTWQGMPSQSGDGMEKREPKKGYSLPMHLGISGTSFKVLSSRKAKRIKGEGQRKKNEV